MKTEKIRALRELFDNAIDFIIEVVRETESDCIIDNFIDESCSVNICDFGKYSRQAFEQRYNEFIAELNDNDSKCSRRTVAYINSEFDYEGMGILGFRFLDSPDSDWHHQKYKYAIVNDVRVIQIGILTDSILECRDVIEYYLEEVKAIERKYKNREQGLAPPKVEVFIFWDDHKESENITNPKDKIAFFIAKKAEFLQFYSGVTFEHNFEYDSNYDKLCDIEIEKLNQLIKLDESADKDRKSTRLNSSH